MLLIKLQKFHSLNHQHILPTGNEESEDWNRFCTSFHTCSKCIQQVSTYVVMGKQKYCTLVVKKKYRHLFFSFSKTTKRGKLDSLEGIWVWRFNFIIWTQGMKVSLLKLLKKEKIHVQSIEPGLAFIKSRVSP